MPSKLQKFSELESFNNCFKFFFEQIGKGFELKGKWHSHYFKNEDPIVLELGCGKGEYSIGLAKIHPEKNFIGMDIKGNRIWTGAKEAIDTKLSNVAFVRTRVDFIDHCFSPDEISEIWITFPDPQPQKTRARKRLTHPMFLDRYKKFIRKDGIIHLKTDSSSLYEYTLEVIKENNYKIHWLTKDLYKNCLTERKELIEIKTHYEKLFTAKGEDIKYISFSVT